MRKLVLIHHGESTWSLDNRFTGWRDVDLTPRGIEQARHAGQRLKAEGFDFDLCYTSVLKRATRTLWHVLDEMDRTWLPVVHSWRLNDRHAGALQGMSRSDAIQQYGDTQVQLWHNSYDMPPPALGSTDPHCERGDIRYRKLLPEQVPLTECLKDTVARVLPFWKEALAPALQLGKRAVVAAHGHSIRALIKHLDNISDDKIVDLSIPIGIPLVFELDDQLKPVRHYHLGDAGAIAQSVDVAASVAV